MNLATFEQKLADDWAVDRSDVYEGGLGPPDVVRTTEPMRPPAVMELLRVSSDELVALLEQGRLPRPKRLGPGRVAWRADEVYKLRDELKEERE